MNNLERESQTLRDSFESTKTSLPCERIPRCLLDRWGRQLSLVDTIIVLQGKIDESNLELCGLLLKNKPRCLLKHVIASSSQAWLTY